MSLFIWSSCSSKLVLSGAPANSFGDHHNYCENYYQEDDHHHDDDCHGEMGRREEEALGEEQADVHHHDDDCPGEEALGEEPAATHSWWPSHSHRQPQTSPALSVWKLYTSLQDAAFEGWCLPPDTGQETSYHTHTLSNTQSHIPGDHATCILLIFFAPMQPVWVFIIHLTPDTR